MKKVLQDNVTNIIDATNISLDGLNRRMAIINESIRKLPRSERELVNIQRKFEFTDNVYNYLLQKRAEAAVAIASNTSEATILDRAKQIGAGPVSPNRLYIYIIALVAAVILPITLIIAKDFLKPNIVNNEDVEKYTQIPLIGSIIHIRKGDRTPMVTQSKAYIGESFRTLRVNLQYLTLGKKNNIIGFTSSVSGEGKTFCAANLAISMALTGNKTIIIDADLRRPSVASYLKIKNQKGLSNYLIGNCNTNDIIANTEIKGFDVITSGAIPPNPLDLISLPRMDELIHELKQKYNTVIIDSPPLGCVAEYIILMKYTDANIYIVRSDYTSRFHLEKINKLYTEGKINSVSILLNDVKISQMNGYSYYAARKA